MKKKGVSPVIATVLLIAIVVAMGMVVFLWLNEFIEEDVLKFEKNIKLSCENINWEVAYDVDTLYISNVGDVPIFGATVKIEGEGGYQEINLDSLVNNWPDEGLNQGGIFSESVSFSGANKIKIIPVLLGNTNDEISKTFECGEQYGKEIYVQND